MNNGKLYIVATPIGNMKDITFRAIEVLNKVDYILTEDTRTALKLLNHYKIKKHIESFFVVNEKRKSKKVINDLINGKEVALISESGTPCISDPGNFLVREAHLKSIKVIPVPGPSALTTALSVSGISDNITHFVGFLPKSSKKINKLFNEIKNYQGNIVIYESPHRIIKTLKRIRTEFGDIRIFLFKELTKYFETIIIEEVDSLIKKLEKTKIKGEYVIIFNSEIF